MLQFDISFDPMTRAMEVTRTDGRPFAAVLGQHKPATRIIYLPLGFSYSGFEGDLNRWLGGELIQHALPYLPREDRGFLTSGTALDDLPEEEEE